MTNRPGVSNLCAKVSKNSERPAPYPEGCIGANLAKRNYVKYLVESKFKAPTYFIPEERFGELVDFLHCRIDNTLLGRMNGKRGVSNYGSFDEYVMQQNVPVAG